MERLLSELSGNVIIELVVIAVVMDTIFGAGRAIKQHSFNSSVGIDGAIRKIAMLISLIFLAVVDMLVHINLIGFIPEEVRCSAFWPQSISVIGLAEFFGILYLCYEKAMGFYTKISREVYKGITGYRGTGQVGRRGGIRL